MADKFESNATGLTSPADSAASVTPNDSTDLTTATRGLYIGGAGNVKVDMVGEGTAVVYSGLVVGTVYPIRVTRVYATDTTATNIVALW
jgi:hypothetical protein